MMYEGENDARGLKVLILVSRFNDLITRKLMEGARDALRRMGASEADVDTAFTPGSFELPLAAVTAARSGRWQAILALGCVIKGDTAHFDFVAGEAASGVSKTMLETGVPVAFGVLTVDTLEQALDRAGGKHGNKGAEAASVAVEMFRLTAKLKK